jgi:hypothetical protein
LVSDQSQRVISLDYGITGKLGTWVTGDFHFPNSRSLLDAGNNDLVLLDVGNVIAFPGSADDFGAIPLLQRLRRHIFDANHSIVLILSE